MKHHSIGHFLVTGSVTLRGSFSRFWTSTRKAFRNRFGLVVVCAVVAVYFYSITYLSLPSHRSVSRLLVWFSFLFLWWPLSAVSDCHSRIINSCVHEAVIKSQTTSNTLSSRAKTTITERKRLLNKHRRHRDQRTLCRRPRLRSHV